MFERVSTTSATFYAHTHMEYRMKGDPAHEEYVELMSWDCKTPYYVEKDGKKLCPVCGVEFRTTKEKMPQLGVVGFGQFAQMISPILRKNYWDIFAYDPVRKLEGRAHQLRIDWVKLPIACSKKYVVLAVPLPQMEKALQAMSPHISQGTILVNVCSVQTPSIEMCRRLVPQATLVSLHAIFGPQSMKRGLRRKKVVVCEHPSDNPDYLITRDRWEWVIRRYGLEVTTMSAENHDREMATVQGLSHFIARALASCEISESKLATTAFNHLRTIADLLGGDSWELFQTIEQGNPFASEVRQRFMKELRDLERRLEE